MAAEQRCVTSVLVLPPARRTLARFKSLHVGKLYVQGTDPAHLQLHPASFLWMHFGSQVKSLKATSLTGYSRRTVSFGRLNWLSRCRPGLFHLIFKGDCMSALDALLTQAQMGGVTYSILQKGNVSYALVFLGLLLRSDFGKDLQHDVVHHCLWNREVAAEWSRPLILDTLGLCDTCKGLLLARRPSEPSQHIHKPFLIKVRCLREKLQGFAVVLSLPFRLLTTQMMRHAAPISLIRIP